MATLLGHRPAVNFGQSLAELPHLSLVMFPRLLVVMLVLAARPSIMLVTTFMFVVEYRRITPPNLVLAFSPELSPQSIGRQSAYYRAFRTDLRGGEILIQVIFLGLQAPAYLPVTAPYARRNVTIRILPRRPVRAPDRVRVMTGVVINEVYVTVVAMFTVIIWFNGWPARMITASCLYSRGWPKCLR